MNLHQIREFAIVAFSETTLKAVQFRRIKGELTLTRWMTVEIAPDNPAEAWKNILRAFGKGREYPLFLTGSLVGGIFYSTSCIALPHKAMVEALELDMPRQLPAVPPDYRMQFRTGELNADGELTIHVYVAPGSAFERLAAMLTQAGAHADDFYYPLLALNSGDSAWYSQSLEPDFFFENDSWHPLPCPDHNDDWLKQWKLHFHLPIDSDFSVCDYADLLLTARMIADPDYHDQERALRILPNQLRPKRYRNQLRFTALLCILLPLALLWNSSGSLMQRYRNHHALTEEATTLRQENQTLRSRLKAMDKEQKELQRISQLSAGEHEVIRKLADFTMLLPSNVMVSSLRWSEGSLDLMLQSEAENLDLASLVKKLKYWKISQLQQRRWGSSGATMITLKLTAAEESDK